MSGPISGTPAFCFVGVSGSGKTRLLERLLGVLRRRGLRVGAVKHTHHLHFEIDRQGKDSYRLKQAGAERVAVVSDARLALVADTASPVPLETILESQFAAFDLVLVEGFHSSRAPRILVCREEESVGPLLPPPGAETRAVAVVADPPEMGARFAGLPVFSSADVEDLADFLAAAGAARERQPDAGGS